MDSSVTTSEIARQPESAPTLPQQIEQAWAAFLLDQRWPPAPHRYVYASGWRACDRRLVYDMTRPDSALPWSADQLANFRRGADRERDVLNDLSRIGRLITPPLKLIGQQRRFEVRDRAGRTAIVGKVDAVLERNGTRCPLEVKSWSPRITDRISRFEDLFDHPWTRAGGYQLLAYLLGAGEPLGYLVLDRPGVPKILSVELEPHLTRIEEFLSRAEGALDHVAAGTLPDFLADDAAECQRCPYYGATCQPPLIPRTETRLFPELEATLERREALADAAKEYAELDEQVKAQLRGVEQGVAGAFLIEGKWGKSSRVELPPAMKAQYTVTNPKGRFTLTITKLGSPSR